MKRDNIIIAIIGLLCIIVALVVLKDETLVPIHYNMFGRVNKHGSKYELIIVLGLLPIMLAYLFDFLKKIDPNSENYKLFYKYYKVLKYVIVGFAELVFIISLMGILFPINIVFYLGLLISVLFISLGYIMPKVKQNYFVGIRTPWTLKNEEVWDKTHALGGKVFIGWGVLFLISTFINNYIFWWITFGSLIVLIIFLFYYSYKEYKIIDKKQEEN